MGTIIITIIKNNLTLILITCSTKAVSPAITNKETTNAGHPPKQFLHKVKWNSQDKSLEICNHDN